ncbi:wall-associated receptor kinase galacturonan-binding protein [Medicago truncatula]|uniref:Wall-associated receptor kinase galacturonan-binding protein n=1 Tax=Medicago truncatula TaxID=3880 RepID=G7KW37_MEDTR|nr:wall-associated receptor kinase galacturonan-binding protein [Medicago truncatula]
MTLPLPYAQEHKIIAQYGCKSNCGVISIPFPFGMEEPHCYAGMWFEIECKFDKKSSNIPKPYLKSLNLEVKHFNDYLGMIEIMNLVHCSKCKKRRSKNNKNNKHLTINLRDSPFIYSHDLNKFLAFGCNNFSSLQSNGTTVGGCASISPQF